MRWAAGATVFCMLALAGAAPVLGAPAEVPLIFEFSKVQIPSTGMATQTAGSVGGLPITLSLTATTSPGCPGGSTCGTFVASVTGLGASASPQFGVLHGTFVCSAGGCSLTLTGVTGVFSKVTSVTFTLSPTGPTSGVLSTALPNHGAWVSTVARAAAMLKAEGLLPSEITVGDLVSEAAHNQQQGEKGKGQGQNGNGQGQNGNGQGQNGNGQGHNGNGGGKGNGEGKGR